MRQPGSHFSNLDATLGNIPRSVVDRSADHKTTMSAGKLYPVFVDEYLPGDTFSMDTSVLARMLTPIHPVMDNAWMDIYFFAVPNRIVWDEWKNFMGEAKADPYESPSDLTIPMLLRSNTVEGDPPAYVPFKSVADYIGIPAGTAPREFSALIPRGLGLIWNEYFRAQTLQDPIDVPRDSIDRKYAVHPLSTAEDAFLTDCCLGGNLPPVNKFHDYFTSALPEQQRGDPVAIPLSGFAPVYAIGTQPSLYMSENPSAYNGIDNRSVFVTERGSVNPNGDLALDRNGIIVQGYPDDGSASHVYPANFYANLNALATSDDPNIPLAAGVYATISDLRYAFQIQKLLEADNRYGTRYREIIRGHFGVISPDGLQQIPEYLGGKRIRIGMNQVLQTSSTDSISPQGNTAAYSLTADTASSFTKSFTEHGFIIGVACLRAEHTYQQGIEKMFTRKNRFDFYFPELANISDQPIYNREIYNSSWTASSIQDDTDLGIFGYTEAWAEYRYKPNRTSAEMRSTYPQSLDVWHYGDEYSTQPYLSSSWIKEPRNLIDRTLAVSSITSDQFLVDFYFKFTCSRLMPVYSIPGLSDHH